VAGSKSPRRRAREFVIQGLYQWQVGDQDEAAIQVQAEGVAGFDKADSTLYTTLLAETRQQAEALN
jgi:N utilization substance protein B